MVDVLVFLMSFTLVLLAGILGVYLAKKTRLPLMLIVFLLGLILGNIFYGDLPLIQLSGQFLSAFSVIALLVALFEATSKLHVASFDKATHHAIEFYITSLILNLAVLSSIARFFFGLQWFVAILFAVIVSAIEFTAVFPRNHFPQNRVMQILNEESMVSSSLAVFIPFVLLSFLSTVDLPITNFFSVFPFFVNFFAGVGAGVIIALFLFKVLHSQYIEDFASVLVAAALLIAYVFAQQIGGNGVVAAATIGFIFGNIFVKQKSMITMHLHALYSLLDIFVLLFAGIVVGLPSSFDFFRVSAGLFIVYLLIRLIAAYISLRGYSLAERLEMAFFVPKGLVTVAVAFALLNYSFFGVVLLVQLLLVFFVYSLTLDTVLDKLGFFKNR